ncbi:TPA: type IV secretory system conjugative DNA transfer family protein [Streptococcus suis]|nr:type IV secretory system conjugative DNA transfer family protein [Streptococcus suis]HEM6349296.1 type IV secretory system conjugative DNA transfer family protein [Streptococcus suis]
MYSRRKALVFGLMGLAFGYFCHRLTLLYDSLTNAPPMERFAYLLGEGLNQVFNPLWLFSFTQKSLLAFILGVLTMTLVYLYVSTGQKVYREGEEYGSARFGTSKEKRNFYSKNPFNDTIMARDVRLTLLEKKKPQFDRNKNLIVIGGSGAGKTFRFVKPNLIQLNCSNIVVDPKDHLAEKTGKLFLENGYQVKVLDLVNMTNSDGFNPFRYVETENDLNRMLTVYFNNTRGSGSRSDPFWDEASMTLVRAIASYLVDFYNPPGSSKQEQEARRKRGRYPAFSEIGKLIKLLSKGDNQDKTLDSVIAVTTAKFALFNIQSVIDLTQRDTMDLKTWGTQKTMVYLVIPDNDTTFRFLSALFFSTVFSTLTRQADVDFKGQLPIHVRSYLDEFANVGEIPDFAEQTSTVRSRNMSLVPILQNIAQLQGLYKEKEAWKTILGNCDSLLYLGGNDEETFKFMSGLLGKQTIDVRSTSRSFGQTGSSSTSHQKIARDLMTADEVGNMKRDECLVRIAGVPVFRTKKYFPLKHKNWKWLADKETDVRWWHYHINPLTAEEEVDLSGHKIRDLSTETTLH